MLQKKSSLLLVLMFLMSIRPLQAQLKIGVVFFDPPMVYSAVQGFTIDLVRKICSGMKEQCVIVNAPWNKLFPALENGSIDVLAGAYITPERAEKYLFSDPYLPSLGHFITLSSYPYQRVGELKGDNIGIIKEEGGTGVFHQYISMAYPDSFKLVNYNDIGTLLEGLLNQKIKAAVVHNNAVEYWTHQSNDKFKTIGPVFKIGEGIGMLALFSNKKIINDINEQLKIIKRDGEFDTIYNRYF